MVEKKLASRKDLRLKEYNYSENGCYFLTICTVNRKKLLSVVVGGDDLGAPKSISLKPFGCITEKYITTIDTAYKNVKIENYIIMPNHIHLLIMIDNYGTPGSSSPTISTVIAALKRLTNKECKYKLWQRSFYDHVIRSQIEYENAWEYIEYNALKEYGNTNKNNINTLE